MCRILFKLLQFTENKSLKQITGCVKKAPLGISKAFYVRTHVTDHVHFVDTPSRALANFDVRKKLSLISLIVKIHNAYNLDFVGKSERARINELN